MGFLIAKRMTDINFEAVKSDSKAARTLVLIIIFNDDLCSVTDVTFVYFFSPLHMYLFMGRLKAIHQ